MDLPSADLIWSFFVAAVNSYRKDLLTRPFPPDYLDDNGEKDFHNLTELLKTCPPLEDVNQNAKKYDPGLLVLMKWVLNPRSYKLRRTELNKIKEIHLIPLDDSSTPDFVFEVVHTETYKNKFRNLQGTARSLFAFHGSKLENFYSILNCGLKNNLNKVSLYGEGIYLSSDLRMVLNYSPMGKGWQNSMFGGSVSCVALCEMIDHEDVKCNKNFTGDQACGANDENGKARDCSGSPATSISVKSRSKIKGSEGGEIPEKYFVVRNDDMVRLKYLLVYSPHVKWSCVKHIRKSFLRRHQFSVVMIFYIGLLLIAGILHNTNWLKT